MVANNLRDFFNLLSHGAMFALNKSRCCLISTLQDKQGDADSARNQKERLHVCEDDRLCFPTQEKSAPCKFKIPDGESGTGREPAVQQRADL